MAYSYFLMMMGALCLSMCDAEAIKYGLALALAVIVFIRLWKAQEGRSELLLG